MELMEEPVIDGPKEDTHPFVQLAAEAVAQAIKGIMEKFSKEFRMKFVLIAFFISPLALAATPTNDRNSILAFSGCFEVTFQSSETVVKDPNYPVRSPYFEDKGLEWVQIDADSDSRIALQHILMVPDGALKHWRQVWEYQPLYLWQFRGNNVWEKENLGAQRSAGKWAQRVYQVDDSPRYECAAPWMQWSEASYWECQTWAPLPRREFTKRADYNVLSRRNRQQIYSWGWLHEEDNTKLKVDAGNSDWIAKEKSYNTYRRVSDAQCMLVRNWWDANKGVWHEIQAVWAELYQREARISLKTRVDNKLLWEMLFALAEKAASEQQSSTAIRNGARAIIAQYLNSD